MRAPEKTRHNFKRNEKTLSYYASYECATLKSVHFLSSNTENMFLGISSGSLFCNMVIILNKNILHSWLFLKLDVFQYSHHRKR